MKKSKITSMSKDNCAICSGKIELPFKAMKEWEIEGLLCGKCYSKKLSEFYPGEHIRVNKDLD